jgi:hypothetical protein
MSANKNVKEIIGDDYVPGMTVVDGQTKHLVQTVGGTKEAFSWYDTFLEAFAATGNVTQSCRVAGVTSSGVKWAKDHNEDFLRRYDEAFEMAADRLEQEMSNRIYDPTGNRGSDPLLMFALKAVRPTKFRELTPQNGARTQATAVKVTLKLGDAKPGAATIEVASQEVTYDALSEGGE